MSKIRILSDQLASRIAAGEVVERPASAVKELLENALDAGADRIDIHVEGDGTRLIRVADNGCGMDQDDVLLCLERHATSKLREDSDLESVATLGFRGEALPSIASVSRLTILSRLSGAAAGTRAEVRGGILHDVHEDGCTSGTVIEVRGLFSNVPARRKFLKSKRTELAHIEEVIRSQAAACPEISFSLLIDERSVLDLPAASPEQRLRAICRCPDADLLELDSDGEMTVNGWLLLPEESGTAPLRICVNRRPVQDRMLRHAIAEGLRGLLMKGQQPAGLLLLTVAPELADINVHPAKREIRFRNAGAVYQAVMQATEAAVRRHQERLRSRFFAGPKDVNAGALPLSPQHQTDYTFVGAKNFSPLQHSQEICIAEPQPPFQEKFAPPPETSNTANRLPLLLEPEQRGTLRLIGQFANLYLLCEQDGQLVVIDQHAAHERILYQQLRQQHERKQPAKQTLLFPILAELTAEQADVLEQEAETVAALGVEAEFFGGSTWLIKALPAVAAHLPPQEVLADVLGGLTAKLPDCVDKLLASLACKAAVKAGSSLQPQEMLALLHEMGGSELFSHCPHGRPVLKSFSKQEVERWFRRG
ncbi:DNA mismatch repair endonuclease MutL [Candidatus Electronema sp. JM]|uniref:DNA mismatch repair endonuclease MutL n=1 Tax=Candidatus Electronema sp. JM TaxID=3401571 RepID=UPI003AA9977F